MRPDDRRAFMAEALADDQSPGAPLDADLTALDAELGEAGDQARRTFRGRTQPTRVFANELRERLLDAVAAPTAASAGDVSVAAGALRGSQLRTQLVTGGRTWTPVELEPRVVRRTPTVLPRTRWLLLAAAALTGVVVAGALGARVDWSLPPPLSTASAPPRTDAPEALPSPTVPPVAGPSDSAGQTAGPSDPAGTPTAAPTRTPKPSASPTRKPAPTPTPEPTLPPIGSMDLLAKACPGGVLLDWTKYSASVGHYHVLRAVGGEVPPTYPADGTVDLETATSWSVGVTDGFDAGLDGGVGAAYRAYAFDAEDRLLAVSPQRTATAVAALSLAGPTVETVGPGAITVSWGASEVPAACFTYGKLVASAEDPDPSYLKGSPYLAVIGDQATTNVQLDGLPSGQSVWLRYELIRVTGTGKFVVGRTDAIQVTYP